MMILFDLDGTLYQTHETSLPPLYDLCRKYDLTLSPEDSSFVLYSTVKALLDKIAPQMPFDQRSEFMAELKAQETEAIKKHGRLFDGIEELLSSLSNSGIEMAICSIGSKEYVETVLEHCNIKHYFKYITHRIGDRTKTEALKQLLQDSGQKPNECIMVGDSIIDLTAAVENNVPFIGVTYGYGARDLTQANALVDNAAQLKEVIYK
ncbi:MAG: HAD family hydrolase, partial [Clostridiales bacterium]|nr:HAD family hydrolase [Clostridiales bacterium]